MSNDFTPPRVVIYGTGQFGCLIASKLVEKGWPVVGAVNRAGPKVGQDLGRLAGMGWDLGVIVQDCETADYGAMQADIGLVVTADAPADNMAAYTHLFEAGINVLCHGGGSMYAWDFDHETATMIDALARQHGVTFTGGGAWDLGRVWPGILVAGACTAITSMEHMSLTNLSSATPASKRLIEAYGVGLKADAFRETMDANLSPYSFIYRTVPPHVLSGLGFTVTNTSQRIEPVLHDVATRCNALERDIVPGEACGMKVIVVAETREGVTCTGEFVFELAGERGEHFTWTVDGDASNRIIFERLNSIGTTVGLMVNRIPDVIAAPSGVQEIARLGPPKSSASF
ncbi:hypothetical protein [Sphingorhabdus sp.]|jgi:hypothetical protein|uniref:hypothetical protein n=1 Tax=Sphingorhabdus sp. TaxID=1902408 RepID=UPI0037CA1809